MKNFFRKSAKIGMESTPSNPEPDRENSTPWENNNSAQLQNETTPSARSLTQVTTTRPRSNAICEDREK